LESPKPSVLRNSYLMNFHASHEAFTFTMNYFFKTESLYVVQAVQEFSVLLSQPPKCWGLQVCTSMPRFMVKFFTKIWFNMMIAIKECHCNQGLYVCFFLS
jgi:hypothetical protein